MEKPHSTSYAVNARQRCFSSKESMTATCVDRRFADRVPVKSRKLHWE
ncbi:hypothetical protein GBAR_LOCUS28603 [Geodia barretti]|uniref:Uncharacterized protein n=1 Tax=Geodia barretti TaxID=519541 RepID=A0AA35TQS5_GEOBA|nr:hypothetical protein GBAR_LOCUS28603 [Geodia barretti]